VTTPVKCPLCGIDDTRLYQDTGDECKVVQCRRCGLVYVNPQPGATDAHYNEEYYRQWMTTESRAREAMWKRRLDRVRRIRGAGRLLDVGCGNGAFCAAARSNGFDVTGTEVSGYACRFITDALHIPVHEGDLSAIALPPGQFDVVTFWHSLEHTADPLANLRKACDVTKPGGLLVVAVPNLHNLATRALYRLAKGHRLRLYEPGAKELHLFHFCATTLSAMVQRAGFRAVDVRMDLTQILLKHRIADWIAVAAWRLSGRIVSEAIELHAVKPEQDSGSGSTSSAVPRT
jgi:2-polyprenyl-3-methyl-5-hydroxy-6-metoxy-1,4-benzoquinol methylase